MLENAGFGDGGIRDARRRGLLVNDTVNLFLGGKRRKVVRNPRY